MKATVIKPEIHYVISMRATKDPAMKLACEHLRLALNLTLAKEVTSASLE